MGWTSMAKLQAVLLLLQTTCSRLVTPCLYWPLLSTKSLFSTSSTLLPLTQLFISWLLPIKCLGQLQLTHLWFDRNLSCLPVVWNLALYPLEVSLIRVLLPTSIKNEAKYVFLLSFIYLSPLKTLLKKKKNIKE